MPIQGAAVPNNLSKTLVCVDRFEAGDICGRIYSPFTAREIPFCGVIDLIQKMERLFDGFHFPQPSFSYRSFQESGRRRAVSRMRPASTQDVRRYHGDELFQTERGAVGTFAVRVRFRRNATWQGDIEWCERGKRRQFRSLLELLGLIIDAIPSETSFADWDSAPTV